MSPTCVSARLWCWLTLCAHAYAQPSPSMSFLRLRAGTEADEISLPRQLLYRLCSLLSVADVVSDRQVPAQPRRRIPGWAARGLCRCRQRDREPLSTACLTLHGRRLNAVWQPQEHGTAAVGYGGGGGILGTPALACVAFARAAHTASAKPFSAPRSSAGYARLELGTSWLSLGSS